MIKESSEPAADDPQRLISFHSERYIVTVGIGPHRYKVLQIIFGKRDGSLFVNFPYFKHSEGLISLVTFPSGTRPTMDLSLKLGGKVTSHLVKYSHHPDGMALFSQTGRVKSAIRKQSIPLAQSEGHIFSAQLQYLRDFEVADPKKDSGTHTNKRTVLNFQFTGSEPESVKIIGRWYSSAALLTRIHGIVPKTWVPGPTLCETPSGKRYLALLLAPPIGTPTQEYVLILTCEDIPRLDKQQRSALTFIGGFDSDNIVNDLSKDTTFLALSYPMSNPEELAQRLGSIDFRRA
jgi:hypothetical protein